MYCVKKVTEDITWVGGNDRRLAMFEGVYSVPNGVSYNSYLLLDESTVVFDTVDKAVTKVFIQNLAHVLNGRGLDYLIVQHMEPDHSASIEDLLLRYPEMKVVCNKKTSDMMGQFFDMDIADRTLIVKEGDTLKTGKHELTFLMAPMVHWPEVMVTYDITDKILFSADAFGTFGALNGALFADEVDFEQDYMNEARRYYTNIVGKYGTQVQALLKKASSVEINMICPLHGFVWRRNIGDFIEKYQKWSTYTPEETGVVIAYASVYGNTENAAEILSSRLWEQGIKTVMFDVSVTPASNVIAAAFRFSHLVFASTTYNAGIFVAMENLLHDLAAHNLQNRTVAFVQNGSWAPTSGELMRKLFEPLKNITYIENTLTLRSSLKASQEEELASLVAAISATVPQFKPIYTTSDAQKEVDPQALFKLSYGLYVLTAKDGDKDNGCIVNTVTQITDMPKCISVTVNKSNYTHDIILKSGEFNVSVLTEEAPFDVFKHFGFQSGKTADKFAGWEDKQRSANGLLYLSKCANAFISAKIISMVDCGTHTIFIGDVTETKQLSAISSVTYAYYFEHIKPKPQPQHEKKSGYVCKICGYVHEGDFLPDDFICPICKHGADDFEPLQ